MRIFRNGTLAFDETAGDDFDDGQLSQFSLGMVALDGEIGQGSIAVPGNPHWNAGDRITIYETGPIDSTPGSDGVSFGGSDVDFGASVVIFTTSDPSPSTGQYLIYMGYVNQHSRVVNPSSPLEYTSIYNLQDVNRQLIGRKLVAFMDGTSDPLPVNGDPTNLQFTSTTDGLLAANMADLAIGTGATYDTTYFDTSGTTRILAETFNSDGAMDIIARLVAYTAWSVYMVPTETDNVIELHYHDLVTGPTAGISINDTPGVYDYVTIFPPELPEVRYDPIDIANRIEATNGLNTVAGTEDDSIATYNAGGLNWDHGVQNSTDEQGLILYVNNALLQAFERVSYACTIGPLNGQQIAAMRAGSIIANSVAVWENGAVDQRISRITLTPATGGMVAPGLWDAHLELSYPSRLPSQVLSLGGQGGFSGSLMDPLDAADHFQPISGGQFIASDIPTGAPAYRIAYQLRDHANGALNLPGATATFTLEMWADLAETVPGDGWSISIPTGGDTTDNAGQVYVDLSHDTDGTSVVINVIATYP